MPTVQITLSKWHTDRRLSIKASIEINRVMTQWEVQVYLMFLVNLTGLASHMYWNVYYVYQLWDGLYMVDVTVSIRSWNIWKMKPCFYRDKSDILRLDTIPILCMLIDTSDDIIPINYNSMHINEAAILYHFHSQ